MARKKRSAFQNNAFQNNAFQIEEYILLSPLSIPFDEEVGNVTITLISSSENALVSVREQQGAAGGVPSQRRKQNKVDADYNWRRITRVRTYSISSEEAVSSASVIQIVKTKSIISDVILGFPEVTMGINDDEEILMMLLAA